MEATDIKTFATHLQETMKSQLEIIAEQNKETISWVAKAQVVVKLHIDELKAFVYQYKFQSKAEEIEFFKETKPVIVSQYYYYEKLFSLKANEPSGEVSTVKAFYFNELNALQQYLMTNKEFYAYCLSGSTDRDELYFLSRPNSFLNPDADTHFTTGYDGILATILANQLIKEFIEELLDRLRADAGRSFLTWTAKKVYLIELIYALHGAEVFNGGRAEIKQIANLFENVFNVDLGRIYKHFSEIGLRKAGKFNFIDLLKERLEKKLDDLGR
jgi:hypothetical protein